MGDISFQTAFSLSRWKKGELKREDGKPLEMGSTNAISCNWTARVELAAAYRLLNMLGLNEGVSNHVTILAPAADGQGEVMLICPYGIHWSQVTASSLLGYSIQQEKIVEGSGVIETEALFIHVPIYKSHPDWQCIVHLHAPYTSAIALCGDFKRMPMAHQNALLFYERAGVDQEYTGLIEDPSAGHRICELMGDKPIIFLKHHGVVVAGRNIPCVIHDTYYLERACQVYVLAASTGKRIDEIPEHVARETNQKLMQQKDVNSRMFCKAMMAVLDRDWPGYNK